MFQVSEADYVEHGDEVLICQLATELQAQGKKPYIFNVGGSNSLGTGGYMMAVQEIIDHTSADEKFSHIAMVCYPACIIAEPHFHVVQGVLHSSAVSESYYLRIRVVDALNLFCLPSSAIVDS